EQLLSRALAIPQGSAQRPSTSRLPSRLAFRTLERFESADERHLRNISREATTAIHEGRKVCARASRWRICFVDSGETAFVSRHARCTTEPSGVFGCDEGARSAPLLITPHKHERPPREEEVREAHANHRHSVRWAR